jgi:hypothetical protein
MVLHDAIADCEHTGCGSLAADHRHEQVQNRPQLANEIIEVVLAEKINIRSIHPAHSLFVDAGKLGQITFLWVVQTDDASLALVNLAPDRTAILLPLLLQ